MRSAMSAAIRALAIATVMLGLPPDVASAPFAPGRIVEIWTRGPRDADSGESAHLRSRQFDLDKLPSTRVARYDVQYDEVADYRGIPLQSLLARFAPEPYLDLAILHFVNGMAVPVPFRDAASMKRLDPFIARAMRTRRMRPFLAGRFPPTRKRPAPIDGRPISFLGNKVVVADRWHPDLAPGKDAAFSPWEHTDTLVGIELVASRPYYAQFDAGADSVVRRGMAFYRQSCQFCHGVRHVGASFGWDFVESAPMYSYADSPANLHHHVAYKPTNAAEFGLMMPALPFMTEADAAELRQWLEAIKGMPAPAYTPIGSGQ